MRNFLREWGLFVAVLVIILLFRYFFWFAVKVDGHSMDPTLAPDERLVVLKHTNIQRGDIVVAKEIDEITGESKSIVKRVIGLPGDQLRFNNDTLKVNGETVSEDYLSRYRKAFEEDKLQKIYHYDAFFKAQAKKSKAFTAINDGQQIKFDVSVPDGSYYLMGDDRIVSNDSRNVGPFPKSAILGEVKFRYWPIDKITEFHE
jgi:signal peptidase I